MHWARRAASRRLHRRQQERDQHGNDRNHHQKLNERERTRVIRALQDGFHPVPLKE